MTQPRRRFPESFKREAVDQVLAGTSSKVTMPFRAMANSGARAQSCVGYASNWPV